MKAVRFNEYGPAEVLHVAEVEVPAAGDGQVQLRVAAAGVNPADFKWRSGALHAMRPLSFPHIVGYDVAGTVTAVGPAVNLFKVGDLVALPSSAVMRNSRLPMNRLVRSCPAALSSTRPPHCPAPR